MDCKIIETTIQMLLRNHDQTSNDRENKQINQYLE